MGGDGFFRKLANYADLYYFSLKKGEGQRTMNKKFLAKLLIFCMMFTMIPMTAFGAAAEGSANTYTVDGDTTVYTITEDTALADLLTNDNVEVSGDVDLTVNSLDMTKAAVNKLTITDAKLVGAEKINFTVPTNKALTLYNVKADEPVYIVAADATTRALAADVTPTVTIDGGAYAKNVYVTSNNGAFVLRVNDLTTGKVYIAKDFKGEVYLNGDKITSTKGDVVFETSNSGGSYSGGGGSSSNVSIATKVTGGKVTVNPTRPTRGQTVTITVTPADGYKLDSLTVTDLKGNTIELTKVSDTKYTFVMPAGKVKITPVFVKIDGSDKDNTTNVDKRFSDVAADAWYAEYINYVAENGLMNGYEDGRFGPNDKTTRAQIVTVLYRMEGEPAVSSSSSFKDVSAGGQYYSAAVAWASRNDIVNGYEDGRFGPNDNVTREQIAAILYRYAAYKEYDTTLAGNIASFSDAAKVSSWANSAIAWAVGEGLINGDNGALKPQGNATRAEIATLLTRFAQNIAK